MTSDFVRICAEDELAEGEIMPVKFEDKRILLARYDGEVYAIDDICSHDGGELGDGDLVDGQIQCPRHGARFDLKTGAATRMPAIIGIDSYETKIEDGAIFIGRKG